MKHAAVWLLLVICAVLNVSAAEEPVKLAEPKPLVAGAVVVKLWPEGSARLRAMAGSDQPEVWATSPSRPEHVNSITNIHNPSLEVHLAPTANGMAIILAAG